MEYKRLKVSELKLLAKKKGIKGYYKLNKKELIEQLIQKDQISPLKKQSWGRAVIKKITGKFGLIVRLLSLFCSIGVLYYSYHSHKLSYAIEVCPEEFNFQENNAFNIVVLDFAEFAFCDESDICELEMLKFLKEINVFSHIPVEVDFIKCKSSDYGIYDIKSGEEFCNKTNTDLLIYGIVEKISSKLNIELNYVSNSNNAEHMLSGKESNSILLDLNSIFEFTKIDSDLNEIKDLILWQLGLHAIDLCDENARQRVKNYMAKISSNSLFNYSRANFVTGMILKNEGILDSSLMSLEKAFEIDSLFYEAYFESSIVNVLMDEEEKAIEYMNNCFLIDIYTLKPNGNVKVMNIKEELYDEFYKSKQDSFFMLGHAKLIRFMYNSRDARQYIPKYIDLWKARYPVEALDSMLFDDFNEVMLLDSMMRNFNRVYIDLNEEILLSR